VAAALAARQGGSIAGRQLREIGFSQATIDRWVMSRRLHCKYRGVYALGHPHLEWKGRLMAAVLACGPEALLSHRSAAAWRALLPSARALIDVTSPGRHRLKGIDWHSASSLLDLDRDVCEGIPITSIPRTLLDLAEVETPSRLAKAVDTSERRGLFDLREMKLLLERSHGRRGLKPLLALLSNYELTQVTRSELEAEFLTFLREEQLPQAQSNALVGPYEVDMLWERQRVIVELDTWDYHGTLRSFESDRERDMELQLLGYVVLRVTARRLRSDRKQLAAQLRRVLVLP
jgi:very-short-patch-repair endonuclease